MVAVGVVLVALVAVVLVRIVVVLWSDNGDQAGGTGAPVVGDGPADGGVVPAGPSLGEVVQVLATVDPFERSNQAAGLGTIPDGPAWFADTGTWGISDGQAYLSAPANGRNHAVVDLGQPEGSVQATLPRVVNGTGLVFRYRNPFDYWAVVAVPAYATWAVVRVQGGQEEVVANTGLSPIADGTTVAVRLDGDAIDIVLDTRVTRTITDAVVGRATKVGMTAQAIPGIDAASARFDDFSVALPGDRPVPGPSTTTATAPSPPVSPAPPITAGSLGSRP